jgi:hypothetical protein
MSDRPGAGLVLPATTIINSASPCSIGGMGFGVGLGFGSLTAWPAANRALYVPFVLDVPALISKMGWENGATVNGNVDVGVLDAAGRKVASSGSVAQAGASVYQAVSLLAAVWLDPGQYWLAMASSSATGTFRNMPLTAAYAQACGVQQQATALPLPSVATFANPASSYVPLIDLALTPNI